MLNERYLITIRTAAREDLPSLRNLFHDTVLYTCKADYTGTQLYAWSSAWQNEERWNAKFREQHFFVAEISHGIAGFISLTPGGYLDFLYVHKDFQRRGVATVLLKTTESFARQNLINLLTTDASITAEPFFTRHGFTKTKIKTVDINGITMENCEMQKLLS